MLIVSDSTLAGNRARNGGAIVNMCELTIVGSTLNGNTAKGGGGAICNDNGGDLTITESTITENTARQGGAMYLHVFSKNYESDNCTFKDNRPGDIFEDLGV